MPAAGCPPSLPGAGRADLQAGPVSNCSEVALEIRYPWLGSPYLSLLEQAPGAPKKHQTEASPAATHCICKAVHANESSQGLFKACGFKTGACLVHVDGLRCMQWQGMLLRLPGAWNKHEMCCQSRSTCGDSLAVPLAGTIVLPICCKTLFSKGLSYL